MAIGCVTLRLHVRYRERDSGAAPARCVLMEELIGSTSFGHTSSRQGPRLLISALNWLTSLRSRWNMEHVWPADARKLTKHCESVGPRPLSSVLTGAPSPACGPAPAGTRARVDHRSSLTQVPMGRCPHSARGASELAFRWGARLVRVLPTTQLCLQQLRCCLTHGLLRGANRGTSRFRIYRKFVAFGRICVLIRVLGAPRAPGEKLSVSSQTMCF